MVFRLQTAGSTVLTKDTTWHTRLSRGSTSMNPETATKWRSVKMPKIIDRYQPKDIYNADETRLLYNLQPSKTLTYKGDSCNGGTKLK
jgi:hypothetical protein